MKTNVLAIMLLLAPALFGQAAFAQAAEPAAPASATLLYCSGNSWHQDRTQWKTDGIVRIDDQGVYIDIGLIGTGLAPGQPKMISGTVASGDIRLQPAQAGQSQIQAVYTLNKYSGDLWVIIAGATKRKPLFAGNCKAAQPLF